MQPSLHILKLCVGCDSIEDLLDWQAQRAAERRARGEDTRPFHVTRMWPKRETEIVAGGSLYWVVRGFVLGRQRILGLERREEAGDVPRCLIRLDPEVVRTTPQPRRAFQGWRYLRPDDAPRDLAAAAAIAAEMPPQLVAGLAAVGVL